MRRGRLSLLTVAAAYVVALVWAALALPSRVPAHVDAAGRVDDWSSRTALLVMFGLVGLVVLLGLPLLVRAVSGGDGTWVNLPPRTKAYWFAPERRGEFRTRFGDDMEGFTALTGVLLLAVLASMTWVGTTGRDALPWWVMAGLIGLYVLATVVWTVRTLRAYRPPDTA